MGNWQTRGQQLAENKDEENPGIETEPLQFSRFRYDPENAEDGSDFMLELPLSSHPVPPAHMWSVPAFMQYVHSELTDDMVRKAEKDLGVTLPKLLIEMFRQQHGGYLRKSHDTIDYLFGISDDETKPSMIHAPQWEMWRDAKEKAQAGGEVEVGDAAPEQFELLVPMAGDQCHYYWCLDYRAGGPQAEPRVSYIDVECLHDAEIAISLTALVQRFSAEELPGAGTPMPCALIRTARPLSDVIGALVQRVKEEKRGVWASLADSVHTVTPESRSPMYHGAGLRAASSSHTRYSKPLTSFSL